MRAKTPLGALVLAMALVAVSADTVFPLAGCWQMEPHEPGMCRQRWGYQVVSTDNDHQQPLFVPLGATNQLLFNGRQARGIVPPTNFTQDQSARQLFETMTPCDGSLLWALSGHTAHARIGHASHHCGDKDKTFSEHNVGDFFPPVTSAVCTQHSLSLSDNGNCVRLDQSVQESLVHTQVLDLTVNTLPRTCRPGETVDVTLAWSLRRACDQPDSTTETFATITVECAAHDLHFGIDGRTAARWTTGRTASSSGLAMAPNRNGDQSGRALMRALDRIQADQDDGDMALVYYSVVAHAIGMEVRVQGGVVRICHDATEYARTTARFGDSQTGVLEPIAECTTRLDELHGGTTRGDVCRSWFGYRLDGTTLRQTRPISATNTFLTTPFDRGQPLHFMPGEHRYVFSVVWNCSDYGEPTGPMLTWALDSTATANRRGPLCRVGCDGVQGSDRQYDRCGVCGGTGSTCGYSPRGASSSPYREYCDGDHEHAERCQFNATTGAATVPSVKFTGTHKVEVVDTARHPPVVGLGTPNIDFGGPGIGAGGARNAAGANSVAAPGALAFADSANNQAGCMRVQFPRAVRLHSATVLNVHPYCDAATSQVSCVLSSDCAGGAGEVCQDGWCVPRLDNAATTETLDAQQHAIMNGYTERGYSINGDHLRCETADECDDGWGCTIDVCVCGFCMHRVNKWCCDDDAQCEPARDPCEESYCDLDINRCDTRRVDDAQCCSRKYPCDDTGTDECHRRLCVDNMCVLTPVEGCCENQTSASPTVSHSATPVPSGSATRTPTPSRSATRTPTSSVSPSSGASTTPLPSVSASSGASITPLPSVSASSAVTATPEPTECATPAATSTPAPSLSVSSAATATPVPSLSLSSAPTATPVPSVSASSAATATPEPTECSTPATTNTPGPSASSAATATPVPSVSTSVSSTATATPTPSASGTATPAPSLSASSTPAATPEPTGCSTLTQTPSAMPTRSRSPSPCQSQTSVPSPTGPPGWGFGDKNKNHTGPPGQEGRTRRMQPLRERLGDMTDLFRHHKTPETASQKRTVSSSIDGASRSWLAVYTDNSGTNTPVRREQIPATASANGVITVDLSAESVVAVELCTCSGHGALLALDYINTGSAAVHDRCGVCGGDGSSCQYAPIDSVQIHTRLASQPLTVRVVDDDDNNVYEVCYYHARQPWDSGDFANQAVRVSFEPHTPCSTIDASGSCDSLASFGEHPAEWCQAFLSGPEESTTSPWRFDALGNASLVALDCTGDALFTCPAGDGSAGYRVCRNISLAEMLTCKLRDGHRDALATQVMPDHSVQYTGTLHATELVPVECDNPALCERVMHRASRRVRVRSNTGTGQMLADFDADNLEFEAHVNGVTCGRDSVVRVHFSTKVTVPWGRSVYLDTPVAEDYAGDVLSSQQEDDVIVTAMGVEDPLENARMRNPCTERAAGTVPVCTQHWTARLSGPHRQLRLVAAPHVDDHPLSQSPLVMIVDAAVPCDSLELLETGVRADERSLADSAVVLFRDSSRRHAYVTDAINDAQNSFTDGATVYGRVMSARPEFTHDNGHTIRLDSFHICYAYPDTADRASYVPFDARRPAATGCMSPGQWLVATLYDKGRITGDGERLNARFTVTGDSLDFEYTAVAATTASPIYIDARWHVQWEREADAGEFAAGRLAQHRAAALAAGRAADDFAEPLSGFHSVLTPTQMHRTRHLSSTQKRRVRSLMALQTAVVGGLSADGLRSLYNGSVVPTESDVLARRYGAYNDEVWYSGAHGYYQIQCASRSQANNAWATPLTKSACSECSKCDDDDHLHYQYPCVWPCYGTCWPYFCGHGKCDDCWHYQWLWLLPLFVLLLAALFVPCWNPRPSRQYHTVATSTTSPAGVTSSSMMTLATR